MKLKKVTFKCHKCESHLTGVLKNIRYKDDDTWFMLISQDESEIIPLTEEFILCCSCGESYDIDDLKYYRKSINRNDKLNKIL